MVLRHEELWRIAAARRAPRIASASGWENGRVFLVLAFTLDAAGAQPIGSNEILRQYTRSDSRERAAVEALPGEPSWRPALLIWTL